MNAPLTPAVRPMTRSQWSTSTRRPRPYNSNSRRRQSASGGGISMARSMRPGRDASAGSRMSGRFVVSTNRTSTSSARPSIWSSNSNSRALASTVCRLRWVPIRSMSSNTTVAGASIRANVQAVWINPMPAPVSSGTVRPGIWDARYMADRVFPVPGGPCRRMLHGDSFSRRGRRGHAPVGPRAGRRPKAAVRGRADAHGPPFGPPISGHGFGGRGDPAPQES